MRFVDVPVSTRPCQDQAHSPVSYRRAPLSLSPVQTPVSQPAQGVQVAPRRKPSALTRAAKRLWSQITWTLTTWRHSRRRAAVLRSFAPAVQAQVVAEPVYVTFAR